MTQMCAQCSYSLLSELYGNLDHYLFGSKSVDANGTVENSAADRQMLSSLSQFALRASVSGFGNIL